MQRHRRAPHAFGRERVKQGIGEMQPGRRGRHRAGLARVDGLIPLAVEPRLALIAAAVDIGRHRREPVPFQHRHQRLRRAQAHVPGAVVVLGERLGG
jgi:hypothetical protein